MTEKFHGISTVEGRYHGLSHMCSRELYFVVMSLLKNEEEKVIGVKAKNLITNETFNIYAKSVVNATGCFSDKIRQMDDPETPEIIVPAAGVHIVLPEHFSPATMGLIVPKTKDGRVLFFLPWEGCTIAGTTDSKSPITMTPQATSKEVNFILQ